MKASKAEIAVFVSGGGTNLQALIDAQKSGIIEHPGDTPETLQKRVMRLAEWKILPAAAEKISDEIVREKAEEK